MSQKKKLKLRGFLVYQCDNDMVEEIMELNSEGKSFDDLTEAEAEAILIMLKGYQAEGITIQGESIKHWDL